MDAEVFALSGFIVEPWSTLMNGSSRRFVIVLFYFSNSGRCSRGQLGGIQKESVNVSVNFSQWFPIRK